MTGRHVGIYIIESLYDKYSPGGKLKKCPYCPKICFWLYYFLVSSGFGAVNFNLKGDPGGGQKTT